MPKTRQQRLAEERAGHPPSPPKFLEDKQHGPKRTRAKTPSATVGAGPVVPAAQSAVLREFQALLHVWVDAGPEASGRPVDDPTHVMTIPSSLIPELVTFIENIRSQKKQNVPESSSKPSLDYLTPSQETAQAVQNKAGGSKPPKGRRSAFRRNPLLPSPAALKSLPVPAALNTSAAVAVIFRDNSNVTINISDDATSKQPENKFSADEDSDIVSGNASTIGQSPESALPAVTQQSHEGDFMSETPRGAKWGFGRLIDSARSIKRRLGFNPLPQVSESMESSPQPSSMGTAQLPTGTAAPTVPKKKSTSPTSAKDARAKNRRNNDSAIKPVKPTTTSKNGRQSPSPAREASSESDGTEATGDAEEGFPAIRSTSRIEGGTTQAEIEEPTSKPTIRWPSRYLDRMNQNKRKRGGEPVAGPGEAEIHGNSEDGEMEQQPGKIRRTRESEEFTSQFSGHSNTARPYESQGGNVFAEFEAAQKAENAGQIPLPKTPIPITNPKGAFKVPSPGDSDWSDSGSEEEEGNTAALINRRYRPSNCPNPQQIFRPSEYEALRKERAKVLQNKPRNSSRLSQSSIAYPSPSAPSSPAPSPLAHSPAAPSSCAPSEATEKRDIGPQAAVKPSTAVDPEPTGRTKFTGFEDWSKTAPRSVAAAIEKIAVDLNPAGHAFEAVLNNDGPERANQYNSFKEWSKTASPAVVAALENMEVDSNYAGQAFKSGLDNFTKLK